MAGKAKWRKLKKVAGPQGSQAPAKHFKKERTKTRDAKRRRMGEAGEEDDEETDVKADGSKKDSKAPKDPLTKTSLKKESSKAQSQGSQKSPTKTSDKDVASAKDSKELETVELLHAEVTKVEQEANGIEDSAVIEAPQVMVTDLDKDSDSPVIEGLLKPTSEETIKEELRKATEEECPPTEDIQGSETVENDTGTGAAETASQETPEEILPTQKSTQTDAVNMNDGDKPVKFFISDDSDSDTAIFVDANQGASNGANGQVQENAVGSPQKEQGDIEITVEGQNIEFGIEEASEAQIEVGDAVEQTADAAATGGPVITQLIDVEPCESPKASTVQRAKFLPSLAHPVKTETQKMHSNLRRHGQTKFPFDHVDGDSVSRSSASDSVDTVSITRSSVSDLADQDNISKTSTSESADRDGLRKCSTSDSVDLDTTSATSTNESIEHETVSKVSITESGEQETMTMSTAESIDNVARGSMDQDIISKSSASESGEPDAVSRTSASESVEQEVQSKTSCSEYEEAEGMTRTSASESGEQDSMSRTSVSESGDLDGTSRTSVSESVDEHSKASMSVTGTSASATGEYISSKSSVSYSSEFDAESLSSTADLLTPKEEVSTDVKAKPGVGESATIEIESPSGTSEAHETAEDRPSSPAWEELNLEDHMQLTEEGSIADETPPKGGKGETEADAESVFFSLYPEYQPGEVDESQEVAQKIATGNPKVLCFRGQTQEQGETQEEIYMAAEKREVPGIKEGRNKGSVTGKISQLQHKLSQQKKSERKDKEISEPEGPTTQQNGSSSSEQQDTAEQKSEGSTKQSGSEPSPDSAGGKSLSDVPDSPSASSITTATDAKKAEQAISKTDNLVCLPGQLGERIEKLADAAEVVVETITDLVQAEGKPSEVEEAPSTGAEVGQEAHEPESKLEGNAKDRKTLVGKARDWIKGVTRMGGKKDDANDKVNDKADAKKGNTDAESELDRKSSINGTGATCVEEVTSKKDDTKDAKQMTTEVSGKEKEKQNGESDSTATKDNGTLLDDQAAETEEVENLKNADKDAKTEASEEIMEGGDEQATAEIEETGTEDKTNGESVAEKAETENEKAETESTKEAPIDESAEEGKADAQAERKDEGLFDIVAPEEELSDTVFKDDTLEEYGKAKDSDDTEVQDMKTEESSGTGEEKVTSPVKEKLAEITEPVEATTPEGEEESKEGPDTKDEKEVSIETISQAEVEKQDNLETISKESEASFVSVQEFIEPEVIPIAAEAAQGEVIEKRRKSKKDEAKSRRKRHEKSKSPSVLKEGGKEESPKISKRDKEGKSGSKKRRHRRRTKSQEDASAIQTAVLQTSNAAGGSEEPKPEDVALPPDDFEHEKEPTQDEKITEDKDVEVKEKEPEPVKEKEDAEDKDVEVKEQEPKPVTETKDAEDKDAEAKEQEPKLVIEKKDAEDKDVEVKEQEPEPVAEKKDAEDKDVEVKEQEPEPVAEKEDAEDKDVEVKEQEPEPVTEKKDAEDKDVEVKEQEPEPVTEKKDAEVKDEEVKGQEPEPVTEKKCAETTEGEALVQEAPKEAPVSEEVSKEATTATEKKRVPSKSSRDKKRSKKSSELASGETAVTEHKRHSRSRREKSTESKQEKQDVEKPEKDTQKAKEKIESPREKLQSESEVQPSFTASAATWSPRVGRRDRKSTRKSSDRKQEGQSSDKPKILKEKKDEPESPAPSKASPDVCDDDSIKKSPKPVKRVKAKKPPELSLTIIEPRDDTPIPSPKSLSQETSQESVSKGSQPLIQSLTFPAGVSKPISPLPPTKELKFPIGVSKPISPLPPTKELKFPPGVSKPISPLPPTKELKFPLGVSKPKSPLPQMTHALKPIPAPLILKPDAEPSKPPSPIKTLTFPEGVTKPISPLPKKVLQPLPKPSPSSLEAEKPLSYPAKPVSPLKMLHFPEGIPKPVSPAPSKPQEPAFSALSATPKAASPVPVEKEIKSESTKPDTPSATVDAEEVPKPATPPLKKPRPRIIIPKVEPSSSQAVATSPEAGKPVSQLKTLKFPEGISKPVSPIIQKGQQSIFKLAEKIEKVTAEALKPVPDSTQLDLPMKEPAVPISPLRKITFPECIPEPVSPTPLKVTQPLFKPKPIPPALDLPKATDEIDAPQVDNKGTTEPSPSVSQASKPCPETLTVLTFPEGVSKPVSPLPQKTKFSREILKTTHTVEKPASPSSELISSAKEAVKQPLIPSDFFKTIHSGEKPPSLLRTKTASPAKDSLKISDIDTLKSIPSDRSSPIKTFEFPEGVSKPVSPLPVKGRSLFGTPEAHSLTQEKQKHSSAPAPATHERHTVFTFPQSPKQSPKPEESTKVLLPASPSPIKIKHTVDFPSDTFPCTKASSPLIKSASSSVKAPSPTPKISSPTPKIPSPVAKPASPSPKISSLLTKVAPAVPKPIPPTTDGGVTGTTETPSPALPSPKSEPRMPKSILTTRLKYSQEPAKGDSPDQSLKTKLDSLKSSFKPSSPDQSPRSPSEATKSTISQTHLTYSEVSKRFTPSPRPADEITREITATPPMTPPPEPEKAVSASAIPKEKSSKLPAAIIQTSEVRSSARYSRGDCKILKGTSLSSEDSSAIKDRSQPAAESKVPSTSETSERKEKEAVWSSSGVQRVREIHQSTQEVLRSSPDITRSRQEDGSQSPRSCDSPSKKLRRRKRR